MTALAADKSLEMKEPGGIRRLQVGASKTIYQGSLVCTDTTTGLAEAATYGAGKIFAGVAVEGVVSAATGTYWVKVFTSGCFRLVGSSLEAADVGKHLQIVDDATVNDTAGATPVPVGILVELVSATDGWVEIRPFGSPASTAAV